MLTDTPKEARLPDAKKWLGFATIHVQKQDEQFFLFVLKDGVLQLPLECRIYNPGPATEFLESSLLTHFSFIPNHGIYSGQQQARQFKIDNIVDCCGISLGIAPDNTLEATLQSMSNASGGQPIHFWFNRAKLESALQGEVLHRVNGVGIGTTVPPHHLKAALKLFA